MFTKPSLSSVPAKQNKHCKYDLKAVFEKENKPQTQVA